MEVPPDDAPDGASRFPPQPAPSPPLPRLLLTANLDSILLGNHSVGEKEARASWTLLAYPVGNQGVKLGSIPFCVGLSKAGPAFAYLRRA